MKKGKLVIISSPSGGGKNSVINALLPKFENSTRLITTTSREMRPREKNGFDYYFVSKEEFEKKIKDGDLLEYNFYAGNYYGVEKKVLEDLLNSHDLVFSQIEVNGKRSVDEAGIKNLSIFLLPESLEILRNRIVKRGGLTKEVIDDRLETAKSEIEESEDYDYRVVNKQGKFEDTVEEVYKIFTDMLTDNPPSLKLRRVNS